MQSESEVPMPEFKEKAGSALEKKKRVEGTAIRPMDC
jgi:hypothetical protein